MTYRAGGVERPSLAHGAGGDEALRGALVAALDAVRAQTLRLVEPLDDDALHRQHSPLMSPIVWDLGHIANFEARWLLGELPVAGQADPGLDRIYDPFENPRHTRRGLPFLRRAEVLGYLTTVRERVLDTLSRRRFDPGNPLLRDGYVYWMIVQHEAQHQETMLQSLDLNEQLAPYPPARPHAGTGPRPPAPVDDRARIHIANGSILVGTDDRTCAYDNERPRHRRDLAPLSIDRYPVTCRRYLEFMDDGGYARPELWSEAGWRWREESGHRAPQGWTWDGRGWWVRRLGHRLALDPSTPVQHVCYHEARAFARWDGGRLPTEPEWEAAARAGTGEDAPAHPWGDAAASGEQANLGQTAWGPCPVGSYPAGASPAGVEQLLGDVYEWTSSRFTGYPGFESFPYREYSEVFFGDDYRVLRGASWATSPHCARTTFRNWDYPIRRQIFAGLRVARDT